jgi:hypothetical protein
MKNRNCGNARTDCGRRIIFRNMLIHSVLVDLVPRALPTTFCSCFPQEIFRAPSMQPKRQRSRKAGKKNDMGTSRQRPLIAGRSVDLEFLEVPEGRHTVAHPDPVGVGNHVPPERKKPRQGRHIR